MKDHKKTQRHKIVIVTKILNIPTNKKAVKALVPMLIVMTEMIPNQQSALMKIKTLLLPIHRKK